MVSQNALRQTLHVDRITDTSKNITLATTSLWPVKIWKSRLNKELSLKWAWKITTCATITLIKHFTGWSPRGQQVLHYRLWNRHRPTVLRIFKIDNEGATHCHLMCMYIKGCSGFFIFMSRQFIQKIKASNALCTCANLLKWIGLLIHPCASPSHESSPVDLCQEYFSDDAFPLTMTLNAVLISLQWLLVFKGCHGWF